MTFRVQGDLPPWLNMEKNSVLAGIPPPHEGLYTVPISLTANYDALGMSHVINSQFELRIQSSEVGIESPYS